MGHGRLRFGLVAGTVLVGSLGLTAPASADPGTVPVITSPAAGNVSGDVETVIVGPMKNKARVLEFFTDLFGRAPEHTGGVYVWYEVGAGAPG